MSVSLVYSLLIWACSSVQPTSCPWCPPLRKSSPSCRPWKIECSLWYVGGGGNSRLKGIHTCFECFQQFSCLCIKLSQYVLWHKLLLILFNKWFFFSLYLAFNLIMLRIWFISSQTSWHFLLSTNNTPKVFCDQTFSHEGALYPIVTLS